MRRALLPLVLALVAPSFAAPVSDAAPASSDLYRSRFVASDRAGRPHVVDATVEDRPGGTQLVLEIRRRCASCRSDVYVKELGPGEFLVAPLTVTSPECQCMSARATARFGGKKLQIEWAWDVGQHGAPEGDGYEWATVTANNLMNVSCFGSGTYRTTPDPLSGDAPEPPKGAKPFPKEMPKGFDADLFVRPGCYAESP